MRTYDDEPRLLESLCRYVLELYEGIPSLSGGRRLSGGERNDVFLVEGQGEKWILRISHHNQDEASLRFTNDWSRYASERLPEAVAPLLTRAGTSYFRYQGLLVSLFPYVNGSHSSKDNPAHRREMAQLQAALHRIGQSYPRTEPRRDRQTMLELDFDQNFLYKWDDVTRMFNTGGRALFEHPNCQDDDLQRCIAGIYEHRQTLFDARRELEEWVVKIRRIKSTLLYAPIHGDMYPANVLARGDKIVGIIDWDECNVESLAYELGRTMWEYSKDLEHFNLNCQFAKQYLVDYISAGGPVPEAEWPLMIPFLRLLKFMDVMFYMNNAIIGDVWSPAYGYESIRVLENLASANFP